MVNKRIKYLKNKLEIIEFTGLALSSIFDNYELIIQDIMKKQKAIINDELSKLEKHDLGG